MSESPPHKEPYAVSYTTYINHGCRCAGCTDDHRRQHREWRLARASPEARKRLNLRSDLRKQEQNGMQSMSATNLRKPWTDQDRAIALDPRYSARQAAEMLGRTMFSVKQLRYEARKRERGQPSN